MTTENGTGKVPEKIIVCDRCFRSDCFEGNFYCDKFKTAGTIEYILKSVADKKLQPIREVYEEHKHLDLNNDIYFHGSVIADDLWQAIKKVVEREIPQGGAGED
jgi:hypothetical protein